MSGALNTTLEIVAAVPSETEAIIAIVQVSSARERDQTNVAAPN